MTKRSYWKIFVRYFWRNCNFSIFENLVSIIHVHYKVRFTFRLSPRQLEHWLRWHKRLRHNLHWLSDLLCSHRLHFELLGRLCLSNIQHHWSDYFGNCPHCFRPWNYFRRVHRLLYIPTYLRLPSLPTRYWDFYWLQLKSRVQRLYRLLLAFSCLIYNFLWSSKVNGKSSDLLGLQSNAWVPCFICGV